MTYFSVYKDWLRRRTNRYVDLLIDQMQRQDMRTYGCKDFRPVTAIWKFFLSFNWPSWNSVPRFKCELTGLFLRTDPYAFPKEL